MLFLRSCPKCGGDLQECQDKDGRYRRCFQCGTYQDLNSYPPLKRRQTTYGQKGGYLPHLPEKPTNYVRWRKRDRRAWEKVTGG